MLGASMPLAMLEQICAEAGQSETWLQNCPTPASLPLSPGRPHAEKPPSGRLGVTWLPPPVPPEPPEPPPAALPPPPPDVPEPEPEEQAATSRTRRTRRMLGALRSTANLLLATFVAFR